METAELPLSPASISVGFTKRVVEDWVKSCNEFLRWQRHELIERRPSPQKLAEHRDTLKLLLRMGRSLHSQICDPDFPDRHFGAEVGGKLRQLEKSWDMIQCPMSYTEAEAILQQAFPDESGTGSAA